jgi:hypothetical protein
MIEVKPYQDGDVFRVKAKDVFNNDPELFGATNITALLPNAFSHTYLSREGEVLAVMGISLLWGGVGELWSVTSTEMYRTPISMARISKKTVDFYFDNLKLKRLQATVKKEYCEGSKFLSFLGFRFEAELEKYGPDGSTHLLWRRLA